MKITGSKLNKKVSKAKASTTDVKGAIYALLRAGYSNEEVVELLNKNNKVSAYTVGACAAHRTMGHVA